MKPERMNNELFEQPLFENIEILTEASKDDNPYRLLTIRGVASKGGFVNKNRRIYPTPVLVKAVEEAQAEIKKGKLLGEVDHPEYRGSLSRASIKFTKLYMEGDTMFFEGEVLATKDGEHLALLLRSGVGVGISTRGYGSTRPVDIADGTVYEVQPDYRLKGIDCVLDESNKFGKVANFESEEGGNEVKLTMETLQKDYPDLYKQVVEAVRAQAEQDMKEGLEKDFEMRVTAAVEAKKAEFVAEAQKAALESDEVAQYKTVVESVIALVKPMIPEAQTQTEADAELVKTNESLQKELDTVNAVVKTLQEEKAAAEKALAEEETAKAVTAKVESLVKGHRFETALRGKLAECKTEDEVQKCFEAEETFIKSLLEGTKAPTGAGAAASTTESEDSAEDLSEAMARQKKLAGLTEGGTK